jgi:hypothetical protein
MDQPREYHEWRTDASGRWRDAFHTFGHLLMTHARNGALAEVSETASVETRETASRVAELALYNLMMILEGVVGVPIGNDRSLEFALIARIRKSGEPYSVVEEFELAPDGDESACMGFHFWTGGDFRA